MKLKYIVLIVLILRVSFAFEDEEDNEFADFEEFDQPEAVPGEPVLKVPEKKEQFVNDDSGDEEGIVEDEFDNDEFETDDVPKKAGEPKLTIVNKVPLPMKNWHSYWVEILFITGLFVYFVNYAMGKNKNRNIASAWLSAHKSLLEENFALIGDDGRKDFDYTLPTDFQKESDAIFTLWCSGRILVEGMLVELRLIKRQDLLSITMGLLKKVQDQVQFRIELSKDSADSFVMALCSRKSVNKMFKEMTDLKQYCTNVPNADTKYNFPAGYSLLSEISEASSAIIDSRVVAMLNKYNQVLESIHISDQYSGIAIQEDTQQTARPETKRMLILTYFFSHKSDMEELRPLLQLAIYLVDKLKRFKLSREAKMKADKNRQRVEEEFMKSNHQSRMEAAAQKREEKRKMEKEKILNEENVEKQIKMERKMKRKEAKKAMPKMKSMNIHL